MIVPSSPRFFAMHGLHPPYALAILAAILSLGVWTTMVSPGELDSALGMVLFAQMFLASSGFLPAARRGHFDALLVAKGRRTGPMVWHWVVSTAPGIAAWLALAALGRVVGSPAADSALIGGRAAALAIVSALAWSAGVALTRGAAGVVWLAILLALLLGRVDPQAPAFLTAFSGAGWIVARQALTLVLCPFVLIGRHPDVGARPVVVAVLVAVVVLLLVFRRAERLDLYLMDHT